MKNLYTVWNQRWDFFRESVDFRRFYDGDNHFDYSDYRVVMGGGDAGSEMIENWRVTDNPDGGFHLKLVFDKGRVQG